MGKHDIQWLPEVAGAGSCPKRARTHAVSLPLHRQRSGRGRASQTPSGRGDCRLDPRWPRGVPRDREDLEALRTAFRGFRDRSPAVGRPRQGNRRLDERLGLDTLRRPEAATKRKSSPNSTPIFANSRKCRSGRTMSSAKVRAASASTPTARARARGNGKGGGASLVRR